MSNPLHARQCRKSCRCLGGSARIWLEHCRVGCRSLFTSPAVIALGFAITLRNSVAKRYGVATLRAIDSLEYQRKHDFNETGLGFARGATIFSEEFYPLIS
jgi:hypothetical protein